MAIWPAAWPVTSRRWASNGTQGSEFTGLYFDPFDPNRAWVNVQHPASGNDRMMEFTAAPVPVPAHFIAINAPPAVWFDWLPAADSMELTSLALKERIGLLYNRLTAPEAA